MCFRYRSCKVGIVVSSPERSTIDRTIIMGVGISTIGSIGSDPVRFALGFPKFWEKRSTRRQGATGQQLDTLGR